MPDSEPIERIEDIRCSTPKPSREFCATCAAHEGTPHENWCRHKGLVNAGSPPSGGVSDMPDRYLMATAAMHVVGDLSRAEPCLAVIHGETEHDYIGAWAEGFGFFNVHFPKATTRELTDAEKGHYRGKYIGIMGSEVAAPIRFDDEPTGGNNRG